MTAAALPGVSYAPPAILDRFRICPVTHKKINLQAQSLVKVNAVASVVALGACRQTEFRVPVAKGASACTVRIGESQVVVHDQCGLPCGRGDIAKGYCKPPTGWWTEDVTFCSNECDVYGNVAVCYASLQVVIVLDLVPPGQRLLRTCQWGEDSEAGQEGKKAQGLDRK